MQTKSFLLTILTLLLIIPLSLIIISTVNKINKSQNSLRGDTLSVRRNFYGWFAIFYKLIYLLFNQLDFNSSDAILVLLLFVLFLSFSIVQSNVFKYIIDSNGL